MSRYVPPLYPTPRGVSSKLVWLHTNGYLEHIDNALKDWCSERSGANQEEWPNFINSVCETYDGALSLSELLIHSSAEIFDDQDRHYFDSAYLAILLREISRFPRIPFDNEIYLCNANFNSQMRLKNRPLLIPLFNFCNQSIDPSFHAIEIKNALISCLDDAGRAIDTNDARVELKKKGIKAEESFISSFVLNDPSFLFLKREGKYFDLTRRLFEAWDLARDVIPDSEYVESEGLRWGSLEEFHRVRFQTNLAPLKAFLSFHKDAQNLANVDHLEFCLKLRFDRRRNEDKKIQGLAPGVHRFIVSWIRTNKRVWQTERSARFLGRNVTIMPEAIAPDSGDLVAYGSTQMNTSRRKSALVTREMVAGEIQSKGLIHRSRILTPLKEEDINIAVQEFRDLMSQHLSFVDWQLVDADVLAQNWLNKKFLENKPYTLRKTIKAIEAHLKDDFFFIGKELWLDNSYKELFEDLNFADTRAELFDLIKPRHENVRQFLEETESDKAAILRKLIY